MLVLVALAIVHRLRPAWARIEIAQAAAAEGHSPERVSRLCSLALGRFEQALALLTRIGRPPRDRAAGDERAELAVTRSLLGVTTAILAQVSLRRPRVRDLVVGAFRRIEAEHRITQQRFCAALALSARTLRSWLASVPRCASAPGLAECWQRCGSDASCVRGGGLSRCTDAYGPCSDSCGAQCGAD